MLNNVKLFFSQMKSCQSKSSQPPPALPPQPPSTPHFNPHHINPQHHNHHQYHTPPPPPPLHTTNTTSTQHGQYSSPTIHSLNMRVILPQQPTTTTNHVESCHPCLETGTRASCQCLYNLITILGTRMSTRTHSQTSTCYCTSLPFNFDISLLCIFSIHQVILD